MAYTITLSDGSSLIPGGLADTTINTTATSITLVGKNYSGYGQFINDNFVQMLENFANTSSPANPLKGQLWWDTVNNILKVYSGQSWKISTGATSTPYSNPPGDLSSLGGDLWFDTTNQQLKVYSGTAWITVGPAASTATGNTGAQPALVQDKVTGGSHPVVQILINNVVYAIISNYTFTTNLPGFPVISAGITFSNTASPTLGLNTQDQNPTSNTLAQRDQYGALNATGLNLTGAITGATAIGTTALTASTITATTSVSSPAIIAPSITGNLNSYVTTINTSIVPATNGQGNVGTPGYYFGNAYIQNVNISNNIAMDGTIIPNSNLSVTLGSTSKLFNNVYTNQLIAASNILPTANLAVNIGSSSLWFNNIYGTAIHALYADLAERFEADAEYEPGTVVELGGPAEITKVDSDLSDSVFGVISTNAAYLMNSRAGTDKTHPPIAVQGRVPVKVTGIIRKGDRLVSAGNGLARAGIKSELTTWNVIGRALEDKTTTDEGVIEAVVKLNS